MIITEIESQILYAIIAIKEQIDIIMGTYLCQQQHHNQIRHSKIIEALYNQAITQKAANTLTVKQTSVQNNSYTKNFFPCKYLGRGIYGTVLEVIYKDNKQRFALKIVKTDIIIENYLLLDQIKFQILNQQNIFMHANQMKLQDKKLYILYDRYYLGDLYYLAKKHPKKIDQPFIVQLTMRLVSILQLIHDKYKIIYRNLRPQNILFTNIEGQFQLSELLFCINEEVSYSYYGAATYTPPQVYLKLDQGYNYTIDYWMLGVLLYQIIMGHTPFQGSSQSQIRQNVLGYHPDTLKFPEQMHISQQIYDFISRLLQPIPENRITLDQIKRHKLFHGQSWDVDLQKKQYVSIQQNAQQQNNNHFPERIVYYNYSKARPTIQRFQIQICQSNR